MGVQSEWEYCMGVPSEWEYCMGIHEPLLFVICSTNSGQYCAMPSKKIFFVCFSYVKFRSLGSLRHMSRFHPLSIIVR